MKKRFHLSCCFVIAFTGNLIITVQSQTNDEDNKAASNDAKVINKIIEDTETIERRTRDVDDQDCSVLDLMYIDTRVYIKVLTY